MKSKLCSDCALNDRCKASKLQIVACSKYEFDNKSDSKKFIKFLNLHRNEIVEQMNEMQKTGLPYTLPKY